MFRFRRLITTLVAPLAAVLILGVPLAASGQTLSTRPVPAVSVRGGVQDFSFTSYSADYYLGRDAAAHATLRTVETFVAKFPSFDQNRGMIRAIPNDYDGVPLHTAVTSVTDESGAPVHFEATVNGGFTELALGTDDYVHGSQTYVITYTQQNVVRAFTDTNDDEFYWDTNGTGFDQPFGSVTARVHVDPAIAPALTGHNACYRGAQGSTTTCDIVGPVDDTAAASGGKLVTASTKTLAPRENLTVAIGFTAGTFAQVPAEQPAPGESTPFVNPVVPWWSHVLGIALLVLAVAGGIFSVVQRLFLGPRAAKGRGIIIAQYSPPQGLNLLEAGSLVGRTRTSLAAQLVSFAVRGIIRILDYPVTGEGGQYTLQYLGGEGADPMEQRLLETLFEADLREGAVREVGVTDDGLAVRLKARVAEADDSVVARGLKVKPPIAPGILTAFALFFVVFIAIGSTVLTAFTAAVSGWVIAAIPVAFLALFLAFALSARPAVVTESGAEQRDYLLGIREYLKLAEADRLQMLQSPEGAERVDIGDTAQVVKLYEKLLPFAVLWGIEREWAKELAVHYDEVSTAPDWYVSRGAFDALVFSQLLGSMSSSVHSMATPTPQPSSWSGSGGGSFSGGSFGGGFSGGGGGGGGGGGR
ncbi:DUF2207 domain-containing protein [Parafrigoribacterium soli]|uniref:DUF2207 domain-containing protein n=1 Tax=Parafrigoribacterium soli TaxID=3144663 RepID=UPI0032EB70C9